ncbi:MAG: radical SAM protein [Candidatus Diapherotrites archaeon]|nr:radical SAM protein [Candidatus Diapherotrites archaeon]
MVALTTTEGQEVKREYHFVQISPYKVLSVKEDGRVFVRFSNGLTVVLDQDEFLVMSRIPAHYATVPFNTGKEIEVLNNLKKLGVVHEIDRPKPSFYFVYKVTKGCNLRCKYCYEWANPEKISQKAKLEVADKILSMTRDAYTHFVFHGGEPTLYFEDIIAPLVEKWIPLAPHSPERKRLKFGMQSNGIRFADENFAKKFAEYHKKYGLSVGISLDGMKEHNWLRQFADGTPAWDYTVTGIRNLHKYGVKSLGLIIVVNDRSVKDFIGIAEWLSSDLDIHRSRFNPLYPAGHPEVIKHAPDPEDYIDQTLKLAKWEIEHNIDGDQIKQEFVSTTIADHVEAMLMRSSNVCVNTVCGRGMSFFAIEPNGDVKPCDHSSRILGNVLDGWDVWKPVPPELALEWAQQSWHFSTAMGGHPECESCPYRQFCDGGGCPEFLHDLYGDDYWKKAPRYCWKKFYKFLDRIIESGDLIKLAAMDPDHLQEMPWVAPGGGA